ncbi:MAG: hypothetical protein LBB88_09220 [Planctomycetaceae bacterium]|jgi:hypothetical protein|nr:hypothetical protein [Planctomycetaceae bacterium]
MSDKIFVKQDGVEYAVEMNQLKELLRDGYVKPQAQMRNENDTAWKPAGIFLKSIGLIGAGIVGGALLSSFLDNEAQAATTDSIGGGISNAASANIGTSNNIDAATNGNMRVDSYDLDGDGVSDVSLYDVNGDGIVDVENYDFNHDGIADVSVVDTNGDGIADTILADANGDGFYDSIAADSANDGIIDTIAADTDGDGIIDTVVNFLGGLFS